MNKIAAVLNEMRLVAHSPGEAVREFKKKTGRPVIGCLPVYCPEEIIHAAGMLPVGVWGGQTKISKASVYYQAFACSIMQSTMELALKGTYDELSAVIIPAHCDTLKCMGQNWKVAAGHIRFIPLVHPHNRKLEAGVKYLRSEYEKIKAILEEIGGGIISDAAINRSIEIYNQHRELMRQFSVAARDYPEYISTVDRHLVFKSAYFMDKQQHSELLQVLLDELKRLPADNKNRKKVILTGIMAEPDSFLELFDEYGLVVAEDDLAHESRQVRTDVPDGDEPLERLARVWADMEGCSLTYDPSKYRTQMLLDMVKKNQADGVVVCMMKFCDPEEFDYPLYSKKLEDANVPVLYLEIEQQMQSVGQLRTRIQSFAEILGAV